MVKYAAKTTVSVEKSRSDVEKLLKSYKADQFAFGEDELQGQAMIQFRISQRTVRFILPLPGNKQGQDCRTAWRALLLCVKAKLAAIDAKISTFEDEFMSHIVLPNGLTVGEVMKPQIEKAYIEHGPIKGIAGLLGGPSNA